LTPFTPVIMVLARTVVAALTLFTLVHADVEFITPKPGATLKGGGAIEIEWKDSGEAPSVSDLQTYELFLCAGGNDAASMIQLTAITTAGQFAVGNKALGTVGIGIGADTKNAYFLKMISVAAAGGTVINYSPRFSLSGMTGSFPANVVAGLKTIKGTDGPPSVNNVGQGGASTVVDGDLFKVPYTMQTGLTRYAPMQPVPPTKITKKKATPQHPTSAVDIARSILPIPKQQTTITQSQTFSVSSVENTVPAASMPTDDMAKFLARWKD
jgi:hypothetical protein